MITINKRYPYREIDREEINGQRYYAVDSKQKLPSVTTILDAITDKSHLVEWRKRVGAVKATEITIEASSVGTRMHKYLEHYVETGEWKCPGSNPYSKKANEMAEIIRDKSLIDMDEVWGQEISLYMPHMYAGTTDLVGVYKGKPSICDYKQTNKPKKEEWVGNYRMQLVAYAEAHNELYGTDINEGHIFMCSRGLEYQQFDIWPDEYKYWRNKWFDGLHKYYEHILSGVN